MFGNNIFDDNSRPFGGRGPRGFGSGFRAGRGMIEPAILSVLLEKPMHGYEIISALETKSHGVWRPSAGSIYPTLQLLEEKDLLSSSEQNGKKVYSLTEAGTQAAGETGANFEDFWQNRQEHSQDFRQFHHDMGDSMRLMHHIFRKGDATQKQQVAEAIGTFRQQLETIAKDESA